MHTYTQSGIVGDLSLKSWSSESHIATTNVTSNPLFFLWALILNYLAPGQVFFFWASSFKACLSVALTSDIKTLGFSSHLNLVIKKTHFRIGLRRNDHFPSKNKENSSETFYWFFKHCGDWIKVTSFMTVFKGSLPTSCFHAALAALFDPRIFALIWVKLYSS